MKDEIKHIISGTSKNSEGRIIQTIASFLRRSETSGGLAKEDKHFKKEETKNLIEFIAENNFWYPDVNLDNYISEGAEQKVYIKSGESVLKLNDAIYYLSWLDYLQNLSLHNYFFPDTAYKLLGFYTMDKNLYAVVEQPFVKATDKTDLDKVRTFLENNGFTNIRNNDYRNDYLGIILEDLHDENVLTQNGVHYFIDTVFYIIE
ncbi:hypothetical protein [Flavobacterium psychraquaticum]|uniref:putative polyvalent protein kinase domain-containing protein n=1 Tax=Flavobacterium psychraquaticum TaxID=3103958 RepID=UPI002ACE7A87|nr:hypothetical protein [Flavobacterium sp. LB-N7T]